MREDTADWIGVECKLCETRYPADGGHDCPVDALALKVKRASNLLYNLSQRPALTDDDRRHMREASDDLDTVTKALGGNPYTVAWPTHIGSAV